MKMCNVRSDPAPGTDFSGLTVGQTEQVVDTLYMELKQAA